MEVREDRGFFTGDETDPREATLDFLRFLHNDSVSKRGFLKCCKHTLQNYDKCKKMIKDVLHTVEQDVKERRKTKTLFSSKSCSIQSLACLIFQHFVGGSLQQYSGNLRFERCCLNL